MTSTHHRQNCIDVGGTHVFPLSPPEARNLHLPQSPGTPEMQAIDSSTYIYAQIESER